MSTKPVKTCLVISYGPVPTPEYQTIEGGGMRVWGLAKGLASHGVRVTVGVNNSFPQKRQEHEGIHLVNWGQDQLFADLLNTYDAVIVSYCMGTDAAFIADHINDSVQLILDAYVPIYVEISARDSANIDNEFRSYLEDIQRFNRVLRRGDYFLCANNAQKTFYTGVLASLGIINPRSYRQDRILIAPFGIHDLPATAAKNPYHELGLAKDDFVVLWFGGLYPWFRVEELLGAMQELSQDRHIKFVFVGGKNPFNPTPDFAAQYHKTHRFAEEHKILNHSVYFVDWVDFDTRIDWFKHADIVISLNQPGEENGFSWRTRVMDFVWGELAVLTNGGDPLSEDLLAAGAALRLNELSAKEISSQLRRVQRDPGVLRTVRQKVVALKPNYFWQNITQPLATVIEAGELPYQDEATYKTALRLPASGEAKATTTAPGRFDKLVRVARLPRRVLSYAKRKGLRRSIKLAAGIAKTQAASHLARRGKRYVFLSNHMSNSGAPVVLMQMVREYAAQHGAKNIQVVTPHIEPDLLRELRELGVKVDKSAAAMGHRLIKLQLALRKDDFVLINTIAVYPQYQEFIFRELERGALDQACWFIHEDPDQIPVIDPDFVRPRTVERIRKLADKGKLVLVTPSQRTRNDYRKLLGTKRVHNVPLLVQVPAKYQKTRPASDFNTLRFFISGGAGDGRKGQLIAISARYDFMVRYYNANPKAYRDFSLTLVSVGQDFISRQIRWIGNSLLGKRLRVHPMMPRDDALALADKANTVICCSLNETFCLYVAESMYMGQVVLRNDAAGVDEELQEGINGYGIDHTNVHHFADVLEKVLNKQTTSNDTLQRMGAASQRIIKSYDDTDYLQKINKLLG